MKYVAGRFVKIHGIVVRARKRIDGCKGCVFNNPYTCICIGIREEENCISDGVIFTRN